MPDGIQRYWRVGTEMEEADDGRWVLFSDVETRLEAANARIKELDEDKLLAQAMADKHRREAVDLLVKLRRVEKAADRLAEAVEASGATNPRIDAALDAYRGATS